MAITESDFLHIHKGESSYILLRGTNHFHLIRIDADLSESKMNRLMKIYPCDSEQLQKLGVHFSAFKADNLRGVTVKGYRAGDALTLWLGGDVREYELGADYSEEWLDNFFAGVRITYQLPPKWEGLDPNLIRKITWLVNGVSIACAIAFYFISIPYKLWSVLCILCQLSAFVLTLMYPSSFTLADDSKKRKQYINKGKGNLLPACLAPGFALCLRTLADFTFDSRSFGLLLLISVGTAIVLCAIYIWRNKGLQGGLVNGIAAVFVCVFLGLGSVGQLNYIMDLKPADAQIASVIDKQITRHTKSTTYDCTVLLPDGTYMELNVSIRAYRAMQIGDSVLVKHHSGAFCIPFTTVQTLPETHK